MACDILKGRKLSCKDQRGGIKYVDFVPFSEFGFSITGQEISTLPAGLTEVFRYEVLGTGNTLVETATVNRDNRTTEIAQVLTLVLPKLSKESEVEIQALLYGRVIAFVHDYNGNVKVVGIDTGLDASTATAQTGGAGTDLSGYNVTLNAMDDRYAPFLGTTAKTALEALVSTDVVEP